MFRTFFTAALPVIAILSLVIYLPLYLVKKRKYGKRPIARHLAIYACIGVILSVLYATILFTGFKPHFGDLNLVPFIWVWKPYAAGEAYTLEQVALNLVMTVPLGFFLPAVFRSCRSWWKTGRDIAIFISIIETAQFFIGRSADIDDLIMNTLGGLIGFAVWQWLDRSLEGQPFWENACDCSAA